MALSVPTWKILRIFQSQLLFGEVRAEIRHSSFTEMLHPKTTPSSFQQFSHRSSQQHNHPVLSVAAAGKRLPEVSNFNQAHLFN